MGTASTRSRNRKKKQQSAGRGPRQSSFAAKEQRETGEAASLTKVGETAPSVRVNRDEISDRTWLIAAISIMVVGGFLRLYDLNLVPLHHDEGVNGNFLVRLVRDGFYQYDPGNYHGPTLYYFAAIIPWTIRLLFGASAQNRYGLTTFNIRLVTALFGLATIWLVLLLRRRLGSMA